MPSKFLLAALLGLVVGASAVVSGICDLRCAGSGGVTRTVSAPPSSCPAHSSSETAPLSGSEPEVPCHAPHGGVAACLSLAPADIAMDSPRAAVVVPSLLLPAALSRTLAIRAAEPALHRSPRGPSLLLILRV